jgi:hypothetical protein
MNALEKHLKKARDAARTAWEKKTKAEKKAAASKAAHGYWDALTPKQRSVEMKKRAAKRQKRRAPKR